MARLLRAKLLTALSSMLTLTLLSFNSVADEKLRTIYQLDPWLEETDEIVVPEEFESTLLFLDNNGENMLNAQISVYDIERQLYLIQNQPLDNNGELTLKMKLSDDTSKAYVNTVIILHGNDELKTKRWRTSIYPLDDKTILRYADR